MPSAQPRTYHVATKLVAGLANRDALHSIAAGRDWFGQGRAVTDELREQIRREGIREPIRIAVTKSGKPYLSDGHHRLFVAMSLKLPTVPVVIATDYLPQAIYFVPSDIGWK
jgi:hypothetical protein